MLWCSQCWHSAGNGLEDTVFFVMKWWRNLQCEWFRHYRICSCQETRNESFIVDTVREPEYLPVRCHIRLRKSRVLHATNDSMWNAGKGLAWLFLLLSAMSTYVDEQNCTGSCSSCSIRRWMMAVSMWKRCLDCLHVSDLMVTVPCLPRGSHRFTVACLFPVNTYPVWKRLLNTTMNDAWEHGCECEYIPHIMIPPASSRERMVYAVSTENIFHAYGKG